MALTKIIGLSGTNGSGKDTVGEMLAAQHGYLFVSVSDLLREEARRRNLPVTREVLRTISAEWRREFRRDSCVLRIDGERTGKQVVDDRRRYSSWSMPSESLFSTGETPVAHSFLCFIQPQRGVLASA